MIGGVTVRRKHGHRPREGLCDDGRRDGARLLKAKRRRGLQAPPELGGTGQLPLTPSGGPSPADTLTSELGEDTFL